MFTILGGDGQEYGPASIEQLRQWLAENRVNLDTPVRAAGFQTWQALRTLPEFAPAGEAAAAVAGGLPPPPPPPSVHANAPLPPAPTGPAEPIQFTGEWTEYFKIWIVNVLLTVATLGIYAAWAKVRKRRYFYANTRVFGHAFEYLADPVKILIGNLIAVTILALYIGSNLISPILYLFSVLLVAGLTPFLIVRALVFNARNTAWRGLRFSFKPGYGEAYAVFLGWPMLLGCTLGLLFPFIVQKQKEFVGRNHAYGTAAFRLTLDFGQLFKTFLIAALFFLPIVVAYFTLIVSVAVASTQHKPADPGMMAFAGILLFIAVPLAFVGMQFWRARLFNFVWNNTALAGNRFVANMRARDLILLQVVNSLVTIVTCGFLHPWAVVRKVRFQLKCLQVVPVGNLDQFIADATPTGSAVGESTSELFDFDLGFGV